MAALGHSQLSMTATEYTHVIPSSCATQRTISGEPFASEGAIIFTIAMILVGLVIVFYDGWLLQVSYSEAPWAPGPDPNSPWPRGVGSSGPLSPGLRIPLPAGLDGALGRFGHLAGSRRVARAS
jgi:hypothetical protein